METLNEAGNYEVTPAQLGSVIEAHIAVRTPLMVWGPPGVAKSAVAAQTAARLNMTYVDIRALLLDPVDLRGIPWRDSIDVKLNGKKIGETIHRTRWAVPDFLPPQESQDAFLVNLEELSAAPKLVKAALYQLTLDRRIGEYVLPENAHIMACGNRVGDNAIASRLGSALASRFMHYDVKPDVRGWIAWGAENRHRPADAVLQPVPTEPPCGVRPGQEAVGVPLPAHVGVRLPHDQRHPQRPDRRRVPRRGAVHVPRGRGRVRGRGVHGVPGHLGAPRCIRRR